MENVADGAAPTCGDLIVEDAEHPGLQHDGPAEAMNAGLWWNDDDCLSASNLQGKFGDEKRLFRLAAQPEQARPWGERR